MGHNTAYIITPRRSILEDGFQTVQLVVLKAVIAISSVWCMKTGIMHQGIETDRKK